MPCGDCRHGAIGREVVRLLKPFGCKISYYNPTPKADAGDDISYLPFSELLRQCNIISLHVPVLPSTINMISREALAAMQPETLLVNCARGEVIDSRALAEALENDTIYGAAIDTLSPEPPGADHPLLNLSSKAMDKLIITAHTAGNSDRAFQNMLGGGVDNMKRIAAGERPINIQNGL
jgi:D-3-phosphoglycerate dehydrogenase